MVKVILIGTSHKYQCSGGGADTRSIEEFEKLLHLTCLKYKIKAIAEEMSEAAITQRNALKSAAQILCAKIGLRHQLSDPSPEIRSKLGIHGVNEIRLKGFKQGWTDEITEAEIRNSHTMRESYWLEQLRILDVWPVIFVCGAEHCDSFAKLLKVNGIEITITFKDWNPNDSIITNN